MYISKIMRLTHTTFMFQVIGLKFLKQLHTDTAMYIVQYGARMLLQLILFIQLIARDKKDNLLMHVHNSQIILNMFGRNNIIV